VIDHGRIVLGLLVKSTQAAEAFSFIVLFLPYLSDGARSSSSRSRPTTLVRACACRWSWGGGGVVLPSDHPAMRANGVNPARDHTRR
jgi:hypothetical protein